MMVAEADSVNALLQNAMAAYRNGEFNKAEVQCRQILEQNPMRIFSSPSSCGRTARTKRRLLL
jgi:hypothetical protein